MYKKVEPHPNFSKIEKEILQFWREGKIFSASLKKNAGSKPFVFFEGPPTANGKPGIHHIEARAFKDVILRFQSLRGRHVVRKAGWDTHGLPVELEVERSLGISGKRQIENLVPDDKSASITKFNELCRANVWKYKDEWEKFTERIGFWIDMSDPYITYDKRYIESVWQILKKISEREVNGEPLLFQSHKVLPYCPRCGTALSSHEVAQGYRSVTDNSVFVRFLLKQSRLQIKNPNGEPEVIELDGPAYIVSWTTTPWTLPGNVALAVGEDIEYSLIKRESEYYIVATQLRDKIPSLGGEEIERFPGRFLTGHSYEPLFEVPELHSPKSYKIYTAPFVTTTEGTGVVHTAVMYGEDDYQLGSRVGLPKFHTVAGDGTFIDSLSDLAGKQVKDPQTEKSILRYLQKKNALMGEKAYQHDYPFCWRCGTALLYYARSSWFIRMSALRAELRKNNEQITWVPDHIKRGRFGEWIEEVKDWAISRERYWGTPLPIWICPQEGCGKVSIIGSYEELFFRAVLDNPQEFQQRFDPHKPFIDDIRLRCDRPDCPGVMERTPEVLDVWLDSGAMPYAQWHYPFENEQMFAAQFPADYISEAIDQTRGWFYTLLAVATALGEQQPPFRSVICLGHVLDEKGQKMSKSRGNVIDPFQLIERYGSDIVRWYMYSVNQPGEPKRFSERDLVVLQRKVQMIFWNVLNYFVTYSNTVGWESGKGKFTDADRLDNVLDQWILARLQETAAEVTQSLDVLNVFRASRSLEDFIDELSTWYLRRSRGREDSDFFTILDHCIRTTTRLLAPFMPLFADAVFRIIRSSHDPESVHLTDWPASGGMSESARTILLRMKETRAIVEAVLAWRKTTGLKVRQPLGDLVVVTKTSDLERFLGLMSEELNFLNVQLMAEPPQNPALKKLEFSAVTDCMVFLNPEISPTLRSQGLARELERQVQDLRKRGGLKVGERITLHYETDSPEIYEAFEYFDEGKTYVASVIGARIETPISVQIELSGHKIWLGLKRAAK